MGLTVDDQDRNIINGQLSLDDLEGLMESQGNRVEFYVEAIGTNALAAYLDDPYNCLREHLMERALDHFNLSDADVDIWVETGNLVGLRLSFFD